MNKRILAMIAALLLMLSCSAALASSVTEVTVVYNHSAEESFSYYVYLTPDLALVKNTDDTTKASQTFKYGISNVTGVAPEGAKVELSFVFGKTLTRQDSAGDINDVPDTLTYNIYPDSNSTSESDAFTSDVVVYKYDQEALNNLYNAHATINMQYAFIEADISGITVDESTLSQTVQYADMITLKISDNTSTTGE